MTAAGHVRPEVDDGRSTLEERARLLAEAVSSDVSEREPYLVLRVGDHRLVLPAARARHVSAAGPVADVPGVGEAIRGTTPVLGELVPVVDLGTLVGTVLDQPAADRRLVLVDDGGHALALEVDGVEDLVDLVVVDGESGGSVLSPGDITRPLTDGLRLLVLDAVLTHRRLAPLDRSPVQTLGGDS